MVYPTAGDISRCPHCGSQNVERAQVRTDGSQVTLETVVTCLNPDCPQATRLRSVDVVPAPDEAAPGCD
jgi:hypothetical protein